MKKLLVFLFVVVATLSVNAQDIYMGGTFNLWRNTDANRTNFTIAPEVGYNLSEKWGVGVTFSYAHDYLKGPICGGACGLMRSTVAAAFRMLSFGIPSRISLFGAKSASGSLAGRG